MLARTIALPAVVRIARVGRVIAPLRSDQPGAVMARRLPRLENSRRAEILPPRLQAARDRERRTEPLRGGEDRDLGKGSASATRPTGSEFCVPFYRRSLEQNRDRGRMPG